MHTLVPTSPTCRYGLLRDSLMADFPTACQSTEAHIKTIIKETWGYGPEEQELTTALEEGKREWENKQIHISRFAPVDTSV